MEWNGMLVSFFGWLPQLCAVRDDRTATKPDGGGPDQQ